MKIGTLSVLTFLILATLAWTYSRQHKTALLKQREARYQATLSTYVNDFKPGLTRAQVDDLLRASNLTAEEAQLDSPSWDKFIKIGQEHSPRLSCSREDIDVRLHFTSPTAAEAPASPTDQLLQVTRYNWSRDCL